MCTPIGKTKFSMASMTTPDASAVSVGAVLPFGEGPGITISASHVKETDSILGASVHGVFAGLNSEAFYGRMQADFALFKKVTLNGSATAGQTSFNGTGLLHSGRVFSPSERGADLKVRRRDHWHLGTNGWLASTRNGLAVGQPCALREEGGKSSDRERNDWHDEADYCVQMRRINA